jgi:hypothetical protein
MEERIRAIEERNRRVETDKAWETSLFRIALLSVITYTVAASLLYLIRVPDFYLGAFVPVVGFVLSTQSLPAVKRWWISRHRE